MLFLLLILIFPNSILTCNLRVVPSGSVCVCNSTYCDEVPKIQPLNSNQFQIFRTSQAKLGFRSTLELFQNPYSSSYHFEVNTNKKFQVIQGFGGAFTDSTGINVKNLPKEAQNKFLESYFGPSGIEYSLCRVPIGGTDFSTRPYSYDDEKDDLNLTNFKLQEEDFKYKLPLMKQAQVLTNGTLKILATPWTAPPWMKTNNNWTGVGFLKEEYYQTWANYFVKFLESYSKEGVKIWGVTTGNEPIDGFLPYSFSRLNAMGWIPQQMVQFLKENLGPTLKSSQFNETKIILFDDNLVVAFAIPLLLDNETIALSDGLAIHWYENLNWPLNILEPVTKVLKEDWFVISSEACNGFKFTLGLEPAVVLGSWQRAENYLEDIFKDLNFGISGWIDWNMALDETGGPTYINNNVDSPIIVNSEAQEFYKQPMFYVLGHFSKFVPQNSERIEIKFLQQQENVKVLAFLRPDNKISVIIWNKNDSESRISFKTQNNFADVTLEPKSVNTIIF